METELLETKIFLLLDVKSWLENLLYDHSKWEVRLQTYAWDVYISPQLIFRLHMLPSYHESSFKTLLGA